MNTQSPPPELPQSGFTESYETQGFRHDASGAMADAINDPGTFAAAEYIGAQQITPPRARPYAIRTLVGCYAAIDLKLWRRLKGALSTALRAHKNQRMRELHLWDISDISGGSNDFQSWHQKVTHSDSAGLLCVSVNACADPKIRDEQWPQYRNHAGEILRPFVSLALDQFNQDNIELGVLSEVQNIGATRLTLLPHDGRSLSWAQCINNSELQYAFIQLLLRDIEMQFFRENESGSITSPHNSLNSSVKPIASLTDWDLPDAQEIQYSLNKHVPAKAASISLAEEKQESGSILIVPALVDWACRAQMPPISRVPGASHPTQAWLDWVSGPQASPFAALLGEYGTGKTWTCQLVTKQLRDARAKGRPVPEPFYFDLRRLSREQTNAAFSPEQTVAAKPPRSELENLLRALILASTPAGKKPIGEHFVIYAVQQQGALVIFDGLDEILVHHDGQWGVEFIRILFSILPFACWPPYFHVHKVPLVVESLSGKVLVSCRSHYFKSLQDMQQQLLEQGRGMRHAPSNEGKSDMAAWTMLPLNEAQILQYLRNNVPDREPVQLLELLKSVHNLPEICERFIGIAHVVQQIDGLEKARQRGEHVNAASIYKRMLTKWIERDKGKHKILPEDKPRLMQALAWTMWQQGRTAMPWDELQDWFRQWLQNDKHYRHQRFTTLELETWLEDLRTSTFIVRPDSDNFAFAHTSLLEFCLAASLYASLQENNLWTLWDIHDLSRETIAFMVQLNDLADEYTSRRAITGLQILLAPNRRSHLLSIDIKVSPKARGLAVRYYLALNSSAAVARKSQMSEIIQELDIAEMELQNQRFEHIFLQNLSGRGARLYSTNWFDVRVQTVDFSHAVLSDSIWEDCRFSSSQWQSADLRNSRWHQTQLGKIYSWDTTQCEGVAHTGCFTTTLAFAPPLPMADLTTGHRDWHLAINHGHFGRLTSCAIAYSRKGTCWIATTGHNGEAKVWNEHGICFLTLKVNNDAFQSCAIAISQKDDVRIIATGKCHAYLWDGKGKLITTIRVNKKGGVTGCAIAFNANNHARIVTSSKDNTAKIWSATGHKLFTLKGHKAAVNACAIACDMKGRMLIVTASADMTAKIWHENGICKETLEGHEREISSCSIAFDQQGSAGIVTASYDCTVRLWREDGRCQLMIPAHGGGFNGCAIAYGDGGARIVATYLDGNASVWDETGQSCGLFGHTGIFRGCAIAAYQNQNWRIVTISDDYSAKIWAENGTCLATLRSHIGVPVVCAIDATAINGILVATSSGVRQCKLWDHKGTCIAVLNGHSDLINACAITRYGPSETIIIVTASQDKSAKIWNDSGTCVATLSGDGDCIRSCEIACFGNEKVRIVTSSAVGHTKIWDETGTCHATLDTHAGKGTACALAFAPNGCLHVLTASEDNIARIWDESGNCLKRLEGHSSPITSCAIAFGGNGEARIVTASNLIGKIWNEKGDTLVELIGHLGTINACAIAYAPNGSLRILTAGNDCSAKIWNEKGEILATLNGHRAQLSSCKIAYMGDTAYILTGATDGSVLIWVFCEGSPPQASLRLMPESGASANLRATSGRDFLCMMPGSTFWQYFFIENRNATGLISERHLICDTIQSSSSDVLAQFGNFPDGWW